MIAIDKLSKQLAGFKPARLNASKAQLVVDYSGHEEPQRMAGNYNDTRLDLDTPKQIDVPTTNAGPVAQRERPARIPGTFPLISTHLMNITQLGTHLAKHGAAALDPNIPVHARMLDMVYNNPMYHIAPVYDKSGEPITVHAAFNQEKADDLADRHSRLISMADQAAHNAGVGQMPHEPEEAKQIWNHPANGDLYGRAREIVHSMRRDLGHPEMSEGMHQASGMPLRNVGMRLDRNGQPIRMMAGHEDFQHGIDEATDKDWSRLVYADWLEENRMEATAEAIRREQLAKGEDPHRIWHYSHSSIPSKLAHIYSPHPDISAAAGLFNHDTHGPYAILYVTGRHGGQPILAHHRTTDLPMVRRIMAEHQAAPEDMAAINYHIAARQRWDDEHPKKQQPEDREQFSGVADRMSRLLSSTPIRFGKPVKRSPSQFFDPLPKTPAKPQETIWTRPLGVTEESVPSPPPTKPFDMEGAVKVPIVRHEKDENGEWQMTPDHVHARLDGNKLTVRERTVANRNPASKKFSDIGDKEKEYSVVPVNDSPAAVGYRVFAPDADPRRQSDYIVTVGKTDPAADSCVCEGFTRSCAHGKGKCIHSSVLRSLAEADKLPGIKPSVPEPASLESKPSIEERLKEGPKEPELPAVSAKQLSKDVDEQIAKTRLAYHLRQIEEKYNRVDPRVSSLARAALSGATGAYEPLGELLHENGDLEFGNAYRWHKVKEGLRRDKRVQQRLDDPEFDAWLGSSIKKGSKQQFLKKLATLATTDFAKKSHEAKARLVGGDKSAQRELDQLNKDWTLFNHPAMKNAWAILRNDADVKHLDRAEGNRVVAQSVLRHLARQEDRKELRSRMTTGPATGGGQKHSWQDLFRLLPAFMLDPRFNPRSRGSTETKRARRDTSNYERFQRQPVKFSWDEDEFQRHEAARRKLHGSDIARQVINDMLKGKNDQDRHLILADWLEEHGYDLGSMIRYHQHFLNQIFPKTGDLIAKDPEKIKEYADWLQNNGMPNTGKLLLWNNDPDLVQHDEFAHQYTNGRYRETMLNGPSLYFHSSSPSPLVVEARIFTGRRQPMGNIKVTYSGRRIAPTHSTNNLKFIRDILTEHPVRGVVFPADMADNKSVLDKSRQMLNESVDLAPNPETLKPLDDLIKNPRNAARKVTELPTHFGRNGEVIRFAPSGFRLSDQADLENYLKSKGLSYQVKDKEGKVIPPGQPAVMPIKPRRQPQPQPTIAPQSVPVQPVIQQPSQRGPLPKLMTPEMRQAAAPLQQHLQSLGKEVASLRDKYGTQAPSAAQQTATPLTPTVRQYQPGMQPPSAVSSAAKPIVGPVTSEPHSASPHWARSLGLEINRAKQRPAYTAGRIAGAVWRLTDKLGEFLSHGLDERLDALGSKIKGGVRDAAHSLANYQDWFGQRQNGSNHNAPVFHPSDWTPSQRAPFVYHVRQGGPENPVIASFIGRTKEEALARARRHAFLHNQLRDVAKEATAAAGFEGLTNRDIWNHQANTSRKAEAAKILGDLRRNAGYKAKQMQGIRLPGTAGVHLNREGKPIRFMDDDEDPVELKPGSIDDLGYKHEPEKEPNLSDYIYNQYAPRFGESDEINLATGYILPDGRLVQMGPDIRSEDHRNAIPTTDAMTRWGWPQEVVKKYRESTRTPAMRELMRRSGAARVHVGSGAGSGTFSVHTESPLTRRQKQHIMSFVTSESRPGSVIFDYMGNDAELRRPTAEDIQDHFERMDRMPRRLSRPSSGYRPIRFAKTYSDVFRSAAEAHFSSPSFQEKLLKLPPEKRHAHEESLRQFRDADHNRILKDAAKGNEDDAHEIASQMLFGKDGDASAFLSGYKPQDANLLSRFESYAKGYASHLKSNMIHATPISQPMNDGVLEAVAA